MASRHFPRYLSEAYIELGDYLAELAESNFAEFRDGVALEYEVDAGGRSDLRDFARKVRGFDG